MNKWLRFNYIRNHYLRYGCSGLLLYFRFNANRNKKIINFRHKEYKYPIQIRNNDSDIKVFYQVLFNKDYEIAIHQKPQCIIDLGANIGLASVYFLNKFPGCKVIAVEPDPGNYGLLKSNTAHYENIYCYNNGIWNMKTNLKIIDNNNGQWGFSVNETLENDPCVIHSITMDEIVKAHDISRIDVLKIDIEGSEIELFKEHFEKWLSITTLIIIELHDWMREGCSKQFFTAISNYNYSISHNGENIICKLKGQSVNFESAQLL